MDFPGDRLYSEDHLWVKMENGNALVGITHYAAMILGPANYVELPSGDTRVTRDTAFAAVETNKAVTELLAPISGKVVNVNESLAESPDALTGDPYGNGWIVVMQPTDPEELHELMSQWHYARVVSHEPSV
jgi:glycine cleavage system H protein